ncbi:hypothetical protein [Treponema sp. R8-4-B8]
MFDNKSAADNFVKMPIFGFLINRPYGWVMLTTRGKSSKDRGILQKGVSVA